MSGVGRANITPFSATRGCGSLCRFVTPPTPFLLTLAIRGLAIVGPNSVGGVVISSVITVGTVIAVILPSSGYRERPARSWALCSTVLRTVMGSVSALLAVLGGCLYSPNKENWCQITNSAISTHCHHNFLGFLYLPCCLRGEGANDRLNNCVIHQGVVVKSTPDRCA